MLAATEHGAAVSEAAILGILSLIFWALIFVVTLKYVIILVRADNNGEGGTLALMALAQRAFGGPRIYLVLLGVIAAALFYGNAVLTPALSVLSAVEGGAVAWPALEGFVLPIAIVILLLLFYVQSRGTAGVALLFGPITCVWFLVIALLGFAQVLSNPEVLAAINPLYGAEFLDRARVYQPPDAGSRVPGRYGRRSPLCRPRAFWSTTDPDRLVRTGAALPLSLPTSVRARSCCGTRKP